MNETINSLIARRSARSFEQRQITNQDLETILNCGRHAASARNLQPWHFTVVQDESLLDDIVDACKKVMLESGDEEAKRRAEDPNNHNFYHAPTVIFVAGDGSRFSECDCSNALQNMAVSAHALGLGSCYIASYLVGINSPHGAKLVERFKLPEGFTLQYCLAIGYANGELPLPRQLKEDVVTYIK